MAKTKKVPNPVYALARVEHNWNSGFGHLQVHVYELFGYLSGASLRITCQTGGDIGIGKDNSYAWKHGLAHDFDVLGLAEIQVGNVLLKRVKKYMEEFEKNYGPPKDFADYAVRVLAGAQVPRVHTLEGVNAQMSTAMQVEDLPAFHPQRDQLELLVPMRRMEQSLLTLWRK